MKSNIQIKENGHDPYMSIKCPFFGDHKGLKKCKHPERLKIKVKLDCQYPEEDPPNRCPLREKSINIVVSLKNN